MPRPPPRSTLFPYTTLFRSDPNNKILRMSDDLRVSIIARRGIEQMKEGVYAEAQQQFEAALKLDRSNSWVYYNLGLLFLDRKSTRLNSSHVEISYAVFCLKK